MSIKELVLPKYLLQHYCISLYMLIINNEVELFFSLNTRIVAFQIPLNSESLLLLQLEVVRELLVGSLEGANRLEALIYSAIYLKVCWFTTCFSFEYFYTYSNYIYHSRSG